MGFQYLADVHARNNAERRKNDINRRAIGQERHVFLGQDDRYDALVAVAAGHLIADLYLAKLGNGNLNTLYDADIKLVSLLTAEGLHSHDATLFAVVQAQRCVFNVPGLISENGPEEPLLGSQVRFTFRRYLADQDILGMDLGSDPDYTVWVKVVQSLHGHVRNVKGGQFGAKLG